MNLFLHDLSQYAFLQYALLAGGLASVACGIVGSYVVVRRRTYAASAIAHCVLGGMGPALYLRRVYGWEWMTPLTGATVAALVAAGIIAAVTLTGRQRLDTTLSAVWAVGMAVGVSFIAATPGYNQDLMSYLFGNILMVSRNDLWLMLALDIVIVAVTVLFYPKLLVIGFQPELARLRGLSIAFYETLFLILIALTAVLLTQIVGMIMMIALLALPAATASQCFRRLWVLMLAAGGLCLFFTTVGVAISYEPELPTGPTIIELAAATYLLVLAMKWVAKQIPRKNA